LVTGAAGKVGQVFIRRFMADPRFENFTVRALCHNRKLPVGPRLEVVSGPIEQRGVVEEAMSGVSHVLHLATSKENPDTIMDVAVKGMFWMLEACRTSSTFKQFILIGGDAGMGHFFYPHPVPVTEQQKHSAYPGCYALSKVLEEVLLEQYYVQYNLNGCCLRAPWIMEKDDFKYQLSFGDDVFGGPRWIDMVSKEQAASYQKSGAVPVMLDPDGVPVKRNFVHSEDLISAIMAAIDNPKARQQLFNVCMDEPVDYAALAAYLKKTRNLEGIPLKTPYRSTWLDNAKAKFLLDWRPEYDLAKMIDTAYDYKRATDDPRVIYYPG
jgi:nucleoside-diphosphate-sugar epimerase